MINTCFHVSANLGPQALLQALPNIFETAGLVILPENSCDVEKEGSILNHAEWLLESDSQTLIILG